MTLDSLSALHQLSSIFTGKRNLAAAGAGFALATIVLLWLSQNPLFPLKDQAAALVASIANFDAFSDQLISYVLTINNYIVFPLLLLDIWVGREPTRFKVLRVILNSIIDPYYQLFFLSLGLRAGIIIAVGYARPVGAGTVNDFLSVSLTVVWVVLFGTLELYRRIRDIDD